MHARRHDATAATRRRTRAQRGPVGLQPLGVARTNLLHDMEAGGEAGKRRECTHSPQAVPGRLDLQIACSHARPPARSPSSAGTAPPCSAAAASASPRTTRHPAAYPRSLPCRRRHHLPASPAAVAALLRLQHERAGCRRTPRFAASTWLTVAACPGVAACPAACRDPCHTPPAPPAFPTALLTIRLAATAAAAAGCRCSMERSMLHLLSQRAQRGF